ncbi:hypothetical protein LIER_42710 [Lithospermum erythrorhizon]|uniref:Uncharacterized protein n=1 Tax=Lithospermum erythrorhizon TaxID=34254 RepID=A0AAV3NSF9_LITER
MMGLKRFHENKMYLMPYSKAPSEEMQLMVPLPSNRSLLASYKRNATEDKFHLLRFLASLYRITPKTVNEYPSIPVIETGFLNINIETTTATAPLAFPRTWKKQHALGRYT